MVLGMMWYGMVVWYGMVLLQLEGTCMLESVVGSWLPFEKFLVVPVCCVGVDGRNGDVTARSRVRSTTTTTRIRVKMRSGHATELLYPPRGV